MNLLLNARRLLRPMALLSALGAGGTFGCAIDVQDDEEFAVTTSEQALNANAIYTFRNVHANKCLDVTNFSSADGANIQLWECTGQTAQQFTMVPHSGGYFSFRNVSSGKCIDVWARSTEPGANIAQYTCNGGNNQQFRIDELSGGAVRIVARHSGLALDGWNWQTQNGTNVVQWTTTGAANQAFVPTLVGGSSPPTGGPRFVGNITTNGAVSSDFIRYWDQITPENEGKWGSVEATRGNMNWSRLDAAYNYAKQHGIPFKQHTMVWGAQQPGWIASLPASQQRAEVEEWIRLFCERYPDVDMIDVVNEPPPHTTPSYMNAIGGTGSTGYDWIIWTFQKTRQYCPNATLILNDYNVLRWNTDSFIRIANAVKGSGYIDALGAQAHGLETISRAELQSNLNKLVGVGLPIYISEYDVNIENDAEQRRVFEEQFRIFWNTPQIHGITLWGYQYGSTWVPHSGLIRNGQPRPAMTWLMGFLNR